MKEKCPLKNPEKAKGKYKIRGTIAEKQFGDIKENQGIRTFLIRSVHNVKTESDLVCLAHNLKRI